MEWECRAPGHSISISLPLLSGGDVLCLYLSMPSIIFLSPSPYPYPMGGGGGGGGWRWRLSLLAPCLPPCPGEAGRWRGRAGGGEGFQAPTSLPAHYVLCSLALLFFPSFFSHPCLTDIPMPFPLPPFPSPVLPPCPCPLPLPSPGRWCSTIPSLPGRWRWRWWWNDRHIVTLSLGGGGGRLETVEW